MMAYLQSENNLQFKINRKPLNSRNINYSVNQCQIYVELNKV